MHRDGNRVRRTGWLFLAIVTWGIPALSAADEAVSTGPDSSAASPAVREVLPPATTRYQAPPAEVEGAEDTPQEAPDFRRHVVPLLGRLGCNGRSCHGSFQGRGGFRLSLFGYDFAADHAALVERLDRSNVAASRILAKPTMIEEHEGGKRFERDSWQWRLIERWIAAGAAPAPEDHSAHVSLSIEPGEIELPYTTAAAGWDQLPPVRLRVVASWSDGWREDVTPLCRFRSNDESVAEVDEAGTVRAVGPGDTHIIVFYDNAVASVPVLAPVSEHHGEKFPSAPTPTRIDELVTAKLRKLGLTPSELCSDADFLRRVSLDLTGTLPLPDEVKAFLSDASPDKRAKKVDELLARPTYAAWWTTRLCDMTGNAEQEGGDNGFRREQAEQWYHWIERRVEENMPYDQLVAGMLLANGRLEGQSYEGYIAEMSAYLRDENPADFTARATMPYYWSRVRMRQPKERALAVAHDFLGVRLECAECHKHPFDQWTQDDFQQFMAFFGGIRFDYAPDAKETVKALAEKLEINTKNRDQRQQTQLVRQGQTIPWREVFVAPPNNRERKQKKGKPAPHTTTRTPKFLGGEEAAGDAADPRRALMAWMRERGNPYFAAVFVNRVWANYFGVGIVDPPDDLSLANPPSNAELWRYLIDDFVETGYDMRRLHRQIVLSDAYQRSWRTHENNRDDRKNFSHALLRRLPAEVVYDALRQVTSGSEDLARARDEIADRAIGPRQNHQRDGQTKFELTLFGKPARTTNCDCERSNESSVLQTLFLRNDQTISKMLDRPGGWLTELPGPQKGQDGLAGRLNKLRNQEQNLVGRLEKLRQQEKTGQAAKVQKQLDKLRTEIQDIEAQLASAAEQVKSLPSHDQLVDTAYLRTLSRLPDEKERAAALEYLNTATDTRSGTRDLLWALLNTKEFILNR